ncbi:hypothetical protein ABE438_18160 [Bosea sp. TWI1241]|uniref:hypothetical protein n=1 Tax=Bosea sp. TWI1241 TaxID=3148904 RepID=UPI003208B8D1
MSDETDDDAPALPAAKGTRVPPGRRQVIAKLWKAARAQLRAHEAHLAALPAGKAASEADAKTLATLARTVRELVALDAAAGEGGRTDDDASPAGRLARVEALRAELGRRLVGLAAAHTGDPAGGDPVDPAS